MRPSRRLVAVILVALAAGGLAAGLVLARGGSSARAAGPPGTIARGAFRAVGWGTEGNAAVIRERSGNLILRFDSRFHTNRAPDLWVYVGRFQGLHGVGHWMLAGPMYRTWGRHTYPLAHAPRRGDSVIIYCGKCDRAFGAALLRFA